MTVLNMATLTEKMPAARRLATLECDWPNRTDSYLRDCVSHATSGLLGY